MINRKQQPTSLSVEKINIIKAVEKKLDNGISLFCIEAGEQELVKLDFVYNAGTWNDSNPLIPQFANAGLKEGTATMTSGEIAEKLDFYGAFTQYSVGKHNSEITLYTLNKYFSQTLEIIHDTLYNSVFSESELRVIINQSLQNFNISHEKTSQIASEEMMRALFGNGHPYGRVLTREDFENIIRNQVFDFYKKYYQPENLKIIISGKTDGTHFSEINKLFGQQKFESNEKSSENNFPVVESTEKHLFFEKSDSSQTSVRAGKILFNKLHPDFFKTDIVLTILGGYFGSRLMKNIREDKGYTYGIGCGIHSYLTAGFLWLHAETGNDVCEAAITEIKKEFKKLRTEKVGEEELSRVKNYLLGEFLRSADGAFALSDIFASISAYGLDYDYYDRYLKTINEITAEEIQIVAQKYLHEDSLIFVAAGNIESEKRK